MIPLKIDRQHVISALDRLQRDGVPSRRESTKFDLLYEGERFPPKYTLGLAAEEATGEELDPESYGGGDETNSFLRELGFTIVRKGGRRILASRAVFGLGASKTELDEASDGRLWDAAYQRLRDSYESWPATYRARIEAVAKAALDQGADWLILPACALIYREEEGLDSYRYLFEKFSCVFAGTMRIPGGEGAVVVQDGEVTRQFDDSKPLAFQRNDIPLLTAISSTIGKYRDGEVDKVGEDYSEESDRRHVAIDLGHYEHANRNYLWYEPRDASYVDANTEVIDNGASEDWVDHLRFTV